MNSTTDCQNTIMETSQIDQEITFLYQEVKKLESHKNAILEKIKKLEEKMFIAKREKCKHAWYDYGDGHQSDRRCELCNIEFKRFVKEKLQ